MECLRLSLSGLLVISEGANMPLWLPLHVVQCCCVSQAGDHPDYVDVSRLLILS